MHACRSTLEDPTHTLLAAIVVGLLVALAARRLRTAGAWRIGAWASATYGSHLLLDYLTVDVVPPHGVQFLWPFSEAYYIAPITPIPELVVDGAGRGAFFTSLVAPGTLAAWLGDLGLLVAAVAGAHMVRLLAQRERRPELTDGA